MTTPSFKMIPGRDEVATIERDLRFHAAVKPNPTTLTPAQIESFNRDGYIRPLRIFGDDEIAEIRRYFDDLLAKVVAAGGDSYSISTAHMKYGRVYDILTHPRPDQRPLPRRRPAARLGARRAADDFPRGHNDG